MRSLLAAILLVGCGDVAKAPDAKPAMCGDNAVDTGEECDDGGESVSCNDDCTIARCGDMKINAAANEQCEDGDSDNGNTCSNACRLNSPFASTGTEGAFAPTSSTRLAGGIHNYTTIDIPEGVVITSDTGILELRATGAVKINGTVDLSGGRGGDSAMHPTDVEAGGGGGGATGDPTPAPTAAAGCLTSPSGGGVGVVGGGNSSVFGTCPAYGGAMGGGMGGSRCSGGGGGGGFAGGGGGAGYPSNGFGNGATGASGQGGNGGAGGTAVTDPAGAGKTPGLGARGIGRYAGGDGTYVSTSCSTGSNYPGTPGGGGAIHSFASSDLAVATTFQSGSGGGGGAGACFPVNYGGAGGGGGGGALRIASPVSITIGAAAKLLADGGAGGDGAVAAPGSGPGGGGSGGVIYLSAPNLDVQSGAKVSAVGGAGGMGSPAVCGRGGNGGLGRIRVSSATATCKLDGLFTPALAAVGCAPSMVPEKVFVAPYPN